MRAEQQSRPPTQDLPVVPVLAEPLEASDVEPGNTTHTCSGEARESNRPASTDSSEDSRGGGQDLLVRVTAIPVNPRLVFAGNDVCARFEVIVGDNRRLWVDAPMWVRESLSYPGFYEMVGELPRGRWDKGYALRFADVTGN
jgi:hypothetical protein